MKRLLMAALLLVVFSLPALAEGTQPTTSSTYEEIEWTWNDGGITANDSWMRRQAITVILDVLS